MSIPKPTKDMKPIPSERKRLVKKADDAFSEYIRIRDNFTCFICGATKQGGAVIQCGHLITRAKYATRWDSSNCVAVCRNCNMRHEYQPEHHTQRFIEMNGADAYEALIRESNKTYKLSNEDLKGIVVWCKHEKAKLIKEASDEIDF